jgi:sec-independent protein translocase protein TatB
MAGKCDRIRDLTGTLRFIGDRFVSAEHGQVSLPFMGVPQTIQFASLGMADSLILMVMALVVFGPRRLPQIGRQIGKLMYEFRKASNDFKFQMEEELRNSEEAERRKKEEERLRALAPVAPQQASVSADPPAPVNAIESPYPGESTYPPQYPSKGPEVVSPPEDAAPRIMPPSTGETVAASRPGSTNEPVAGPDGDTGPEVPSASSEGGTSQTDMAERQKDQPSPATEGLNQHG